MIPSLNRILDLIATKSLNRILGPTATKSLDPSRIVTRILVQSLKATKNLIQATGRLMNLKLMLTMTTHGGLWTANRR